MSFDAYWKRLIDATPGLRDTGAVMRISVLNFRMAIRGAYETGRNDEAEAIAREARSLMPDFFKGLGL